MKPCQETPKPKIKEQKLKMQIKNARIFMFLICVFGFWFLSFGFTQAGWTSGKYGSAINFDGVNDYVSSNSSLAAASAFSYSLWFKSSDGAFAADEYLFSQGTNDPSVYLESTDNKVKVMADVADKLSSTKTVNNTQWHHLEITADGTTIKLYLDGILEASAGYTGSSAAGILYVASNATPGSYFGGIIDDVKVYSYARTSDEVLTDYNNGKAAHLGKDSQRDDGLVGYWNMEEGRGQTVYDRSGNANNGTLGASTAVAKDDPVFTGGYSSAGAGGTTLKFDGVNDYVDVGDINTLNNATQFSISAWLVDNQINSLNVRAWFRKQLNDNNDVTFSTYNGLIYFEVGNGANPYGYWSGYSTTISQGTWYHIVVVYDGNQTGNADRAKMYINGIERTLTFSGTIPATSSNLTGVNATISSSAEKWNGSIDEVRIYNRALSADEIYTHYNQKKPVLDMKFDEGSGTSTKDESFNNNDGTLYSNVTSCSNPPTAGCPTWTTGKFGSALSFDGVDDYVSVNNSATLSATNAITVQTWVKTSNSNAMKGILTKPDGANYVYLFYVLSSPTNIRFYIQTSGGSFPYVDSGTIISDGVWHHLAGIFDGRYLKIYIDGILKGTNDLGGTYTIKTTTDPFYIAKLGTDYFQGSIDEPRIYNYARTQDEILVDYNNGVAARLR